jgi:hypothetical protein
MLFQELTLEDPETLNVSLYARFMELSGTDRIRQSHHFAGRFENIYMAEADIPDIATVLNVAKQQAGQLLGIAADILKAGFWFNAMEAGHRTVTHHHDENDELLSVVYYIRVPENSGALILHDDDKRIRIQPREGKLVMFAPKVLHEVTANHSSELRLSVAINVGPAGD